MTESNLEGKIMILTVVFVNFISLLLQCLEFAFVTLKVADRLPDERLELLQHDDTVYTLLSRHLDRVDGDDVVVLCFDFLRALR